MTQVSKYPIHADIANRIFELFVKSFLHTKNNKDAEEFIADFFTPTERIMLAKRFAIAFLLLKGWSSRSISSILRVSLATVTAVSRAEKYGSKGYKNLIEKISKEEKIKDIFEEIAKKAVSIPAASNKGGGLWRYLKQELESNKKKISF